MKEVRRTSITASGPKERGEAREAYMCYLMNYPLEDDAIEKAINFYLGQLAYEILSGRESALEMVNAMVVKLPVVRFCLYTRAASLQRHDHCVEESYSQRHLLWSP
jgi:hypothetical protein